MIKIASGDNIRAFIGCSDDTKPVNKADGTGAVGTSYLSASSEEEYTCGYIGQGSTFFELDTQKVYMYDESPEAAANDEQWVEINTSKVHVIINAR